MPRWGMVIDLAKCTACQACVVACESENNIPSVPPDEANRGRMLSWINLLPELQGRYPRLSMRVMPVSCVHCDNPPCVRVCPVGATALTPDGIVRQTFSRCIGCRYCTNACPYTRRLFNWSSPVFPGDFAEALNPDVSVRPVGVVEKCTLCHHRLLKARDEARAANRRMQPEDYRPACVESCPADAMYFGDVSDPAGPLAEMARSPRSYTLLAKLGTQPKVTYLNDGEWHGG
jgi:menaquinone reductase, iron-sulfur cluster-binding subunit